MASIIIFSIIFLVFAIFLIILRDKFIHDDNPIVLFLIFSVLSIVFGNYFGGIFSYSIIIYLFSIIYFSQFLKVKYSIVYLVMILSIEIIPPVIMKWKQSVLNILNLNWNNVIIFSIASISSIITGVIGRNYRNKLREEYERVFSGRVIKTDSRHKITKRSKEELFQETQLSFDESLKELFNSLKKALNISGIFLFLTDNPDIPSVHLQNYLSDFEEDIHLNNELRPGNSPVSFVLKEKIPLIIPQIKTGSTELGYYLNDSGINSIIVIPIMDGKDLKGILVCDSIRKNHFLEFHKVILNHAVMVIKSMLHNSNSLVKLINEAKEFNTLYELVKGLSEPLDIKAVFDRMGSFLKKSLNQPPFRIVGLNLENKNFYSLIYTDGEFDFDINKLKDTTFKVKETGIIASIFEFKKAIWRFLDENEKISLNLDYLETNHPDTSSFLALPLKFQDDILGIFLLEYRSPEAFSKYELKLIELAGEHCGTVLQNIKLFNQMSNLAQIDGLTELPNHRVFQEKLDNAIKRSLRSDRPVSLIMMDIDHFKNFNDTYGHSTGDAVLKAVSKVIREHIREIDFPARYGGEEFAIILEETGKKQAFEVGERIRFEIAKKNFFLNNQNLKITISLGIAEFPLDAVDKKQLIENADSALYTAKESGRNKVEIFIKGRAI